MKILAFLNSYSEGKSGGDMCFIEIFKRLPSQKLTVMTSSLGKKLCTSNRLKATFIITTNERTFRFIILIYILRILKGIFFAIKTSQVDVIYITSDAWPDVLPALFSKLRNPKAKVIAKIFHLIPQTRILSSTTQHISHLLLKMVADRIIVDNLLLKEELITTGFLSSRIDINYPAIDSQQLQKIKGEKQYTATFIGRLHQSKGILDLIDIWKQVIKKKPEATLGIIGKGDVYTTKLLQEKIKKNNLSKHVTLTGFLPDEHAFSLIKGSSVFIFPSHEEGFGMVIGETLALGVPVVTYNLPVYKETFNSAIIPIERFEKKQFSKTIIDVLDNPKNYDTFVATGKKIIKKFTWEIAAKKELEIINI